MSEEFVMCDMCESVKLLSDIVKWLNVCQTCYDTIPEHIPLNQDQQYIAEFVRKKNELCNM
jgi:hypothetical protein